jgi:hypothetical protein
VDRGDDGIDDFGVQRLGTVGIAWVKMHRTGARGDALGRVIRKLLHRHGHRRVVALRERPVEGGLEQHRSDAGSGSRTTPTWDRTGRDRPRR